MKQAFTVDTSPTHNPNNIPGPNTNPGVGDDNPNDDPVDPNAPPNKTTNDTADVDTKIVLAVTGLSEDTGTPGDFNTSDTTLVFSGTAENADGKTVVLSVGDTQLGSAVIANGKWELDATTTEFKHGNYELLVRLGDGNGVVPDNPVEVKQAFTVDTQAPATPKLSLPSGTDAYLNKTETELIIEVSADTLEAGTEIQLQHGTRNLGSAYKLTEDDANAGKVSRKLTKEMLGSEDGAYDITITITDEVGNKSTSEKLTVTVDTEAPKAAIITNLTLQNSDIIVTGTAELKSGDTLSVTIIGATYENIAVDADGKWTVNTGTQTAKDSATPGAPTGGEYEVIAVVADASGNLTSARNIITPAVTDADGNSTTKVKFDIDGDGSIEEEITVTVDKNGDEISKETKRKGLDGEEVTVKDDTTREKDADNNDVTTVSRDLDGDGQADQKVRVIKNEQGQEIGREVDTVDRETDDSGNVTTTTSTDEDGDGRPDRIVEETTKKTPDGGSQKTTGTDEDGDGLPDQIVRITYDENGKETGRETETLTYKIEGQPQRLVTTSTKTEPDNSKIVTTMQDTDGDGKADSVVREMFNAAGEKTGSETETITRTTDKNGNTVVTTSTDIVPEVRQALKIEASPPDGPADTQTPSSNSDSAILAITGLRDDTGTPGDFRTSDTSLVVTGTASSSDEGKTVVLRIADGNGNIGRWLGTGKIRNGEWSVDATGTTLEHGDYTLIAQLEGNSRVVREAISKSGEVLSKEVDTITRVGDISNPNTITTTTETDVDGDGLADRVEKIEQNGATRSSYSQGFVTRETENGQTTTTTVERVIVNAGSDKNQVTRVVTDANGKVLSTVTNQYEQSRDGFVTIVAEVDGNSQRVGEAHTFDYLFRGSLPTTEVDEWVKATGAERRPSEVTKHEFASTGDLSNKIETYYMHRNDTDAIGAVRLMFDATTGQETARVYEVYDFTRGSDLLGVTTYYDDDTDGLADRSETKVIYGNLHDLFQYLGGSEIYLAMHNSRLGDTLVAKSSATINRVPLADDATRVETSTDADGDGKIDTVVRETFDKDGTTTAISTDTITRTVNAKSETLTTTSTDDDKDGKADKVVRVLTSANGDEISRETDTITRSVDGKQTTTDTDFNNDNVRDQRVIAEDTDGDGKTDKVTRITYGGQNGTHETGRQIDKISRETDTLYGTVTTITQTDRDNNGTPDYVTTETVYEDGRKTTSIGTVARTTATDPDTKLRTTESRFDTDGDGLVDRVLTETETADAFLPNDWSTVVTRPDGSQTKTTVIHCVHEQDDFSTGRTVRTLQREENIETDLNGDGIVDISTSLLLFQTSSGEWRPLGNVTVKVLENIGDELVIIDAAIAAHRIAGDLKYVVRAVDRDASKFGFDGQSSLLRLLDNPDYETKQSYEITVYAIITGRPVDNFPLTIRIEVIDVAEETSVSPIVLDLAGDGVSYNTDGVLFDTDQDGVKERVTWVGGDDALLAFDKNGDGAITETDEISFVGYLPGAKTDLEGLRAFDSNQNGLLDAGDEAFDQFVIWQDVNQDGVSDAGELLSLTAANIATLDLLSDGQQSSPAAGVMQFGQAAYSRTDGTEGVLLDIGLSYSEEPPLNDDNGSALSPDII